MAALDRLDELEVFMLRLQPEDLFRPHSLWRLPLLGSHDYRLPQTIAERLGDLDDIAGDLAAAPIELVVFATDVSQDVHGSGARAYELTYSSRTTPPRRWRRPCSPRLPSARSCSAAGRRAPRD
jgi:hypothetical protein